MGEIKITRGKITIRDRKTGNIVNEIEIPAGQIIKYWPEKEPDNSHRERLNREKDGLLHPQIAQDIIRIRDSVSYIGKEGNLLGKYNMFMFTLSPKPKTLQRKGGNEQSKQRNIYKDYITEEFKKNRDALEKFKGLKIFVYLCFYLRKKKFEGTDLDNYPKLILDCLKPFSGDDSQIITLLLEKKQLYVDYHKADLDFIENTLIIVAEENARKDIFKVIY